MTVANTLQRIRRRLFAESAPPLEPIGQIGELQLAEIRAIFPMQKFFVLGYARSGTTLLARLLRLHPAVHCEWQGHFFSQETAFVDLFNSQALNAWMERPSNRWTTGEHLLPAMERLVIDYLLERKASLLGKSIVGDKSPTLYGEDAAVKLSKLYPDAIVFNIVRDGRDVAVSRRFQLFIDQPEYMNAQDSALREQFRQDSQPFLDGTKSIFTEAWLKSEAEGWHSHVDQTDAFCREVIGERYFTLRFEDLLSDPVPLMHAAWNKLGVEQKLSKFDEAILSEMKNNPAADWHQKTDADLVQDLARGASGGWQTLMTNRDKAMYESIAASTLNQWNYEAGQ